MVVMAARNGEGVLHALAQLVRPTTVLMMTARVRRGLCQCCVAMPKRFMLPMPCLTFTRRLEKVRLDSFVRASVPSFRLFVRHLHRRPMIADIAAAFDIRRRGHAGLVMDFLVMNLSFPQGRDCRDDRPLIARMALDEYLILHRACFFLPE